MVDGFGMYRCEDCTARLNEQNPGTRHHIHSEPLIRALLAHRVNCQFNERSHEVRSQMATLRGCGHFEQQFRQ